MIRILCMSCIFASITLFTACSNPPDHSTEIGEMMFPRTGIRTGKFSKKEIDPALLKLTGCEDICIWEYSISLGSSGQSKGYLFEKRSSDLTGHGGRILFGHWLGGVQNVDSSEWEFFQEAVQYAKEGHRCAIPSGKYPWMTAPTGTADDVTLTKQQVTEYRAALDLLWSRPGGKGQRAMFVGHDYGAMFGILTAAADERVGAMVVMAPVSRFWKWNRIIQPIRGKEEMDRYQALLDPYDPVSLIGELDVPVLFQYVKRDQFVDEKDALELFNAAKRAKAEIRWYTGSHALNRHEPASIDREAWVRTRFTEWESERMQ